MSFFRRPVGEILESCWKAPAALAKSSSEAIGQLLESLWRVSVILNRGVENAEGGERGEGGEEARSRLRAS